PNCVDAPPLLLLFLQVGMINCQSTTARLSFSATAPPTRKSGEPSSMRFPRRCHRQNLHRLSTCRITGVWTIPSFLWLRPPAGFLCIRKHSLLLLYSIL